MHRHIEGDQAEFDRRLGGPGFRDYAAQPYPWPAGRAEDDQLAARAAAILGSGSDPHVTRIRDRRSCVPPSSAHRTDDLPQFGCWYLRFIAPNGRHYAVEVDRDTVRNFDFGLFEPAYMAVIGIESVVLAVLISRLTLKPLRLLADASQTFSRSLDPIVLPESGPREIRLALRTFNTMQKRVRDGVAARTELLASISHDLQTPLTRIRLRLEQVEDLPLRERLLGDPAITLGLVRSGLDLATSGETTEDWAIVNIDALLDAIATDAQEIGRDLRHVLTTGLRANVKPRALSRTLQNLCDNASRYAGAARLRSEWAPDGIRILVEDRGPGLPRDRLKAAFTPFARGPNSRREGAGLGLAIARAQAATFGGSVALEIRKNGGIRAIVGIPHQLS